MNDMPELSRIIDEAMNRKDMGVNALSRAAQSNDLPLSSSTISLYRRGRLPKTIPSETLDAFAQLLDIPKDDLYRAAYGDDVTEDDITARASLSDSISQLPEHQQKLVRQLIHELARQKDSHNDEGTFESPASGYLARSTPGRFEVIDIHAETDAIAARNRRDGDPDIDDDNLLGDA